MKNLDEKAAIDTWFQAIVSDNELITPNHVRAALYADKPRLVSAVFERGCNLQCKHCFYTAESFTAPQRDIYDMTQSLQSLAKEFARNGEFHLLHAGRVLQPWHISALVGIKAECSDAKIGLIDSGHYTRIVKIIIDSGLTFDWIDISLDGDKLRHNLQRKSAHAFAMAEAGIQRAHEILSPSGRLTCLFTWTSINSDSLLVAARIALRTTSEFHVSPVSPRNGLAHLTPSRDQTKVMWSQLIKATEEFGSERVVLRIYSTDDILRIAEIVGYGEMLYAFSNVLVYPNTAGCLLNVRGVRITFFPPSLWPKEEVIIDADGYYRLGYSGQFKLSELRSGRSQAGIDIGPYTVGKPTEENFLMLHERCVSQWWSTIGKGKFEREIHMLKKLRESSR